MNRFIAILGALAAGGAAYATKDWKSVETDRLRGGAKSAAAGAGAADGAATAKPAEVKPAVPAGPVFKREITDLLLPQAESSVEVIAKSVIELRLAINEDGESALSWWGGGKSQPVTSFTAMHKDLGKRGGFSVVVIADQRATWQWVCWILQTSSEAYLTQAWIGAANAAEPKNLRGFSVPVPATKDTPLPRRGRTLRGDGEGRRHRRPRRGRCRRQGAEERRR